MPWVTNNTSVRLAAVLILGGLGLSACATTDYVDEHIAAVNARVDTVRAQEVIHSLAILQKRVAELGILDLSAQRKLFQGEARTRLDPRDSQCL